MNDIWPKFGNHKGLGLGLMGAAIGVALYGSFIVIWRHDPKFIPGTPVYLVTFLLLGVSIVLCHMGAKDLREP
jgi:hypothetical protein